jgi:hypothetical protein
VTPATSVAAASDSGWLEVNNDWLDVVLLACPNICVSIQTQQEAENPEFTQGIDLDASSGPTLQGCISTSTPLGPEVQLDASGTLIFRMAGTCTAGAMYAWQAILPDATRVCGRHDGSCQMFLRDGSTCKQTSGSHGDTHTSWVASMPDGEQLEHLYTAPKEHDKPADPESSEGCDQRGEPNSQVWAEVGLHHACGY